MSQGRVAHIVALAILLNAAPALSQCAVANANAVATNVGGYIKGSDASASYAFKGQTAPAEGLFCNGCAKFEAGATSGTAGDWYTLDTVAAGAVATDTGFYCPSAGTACSSYAVGATAPSAGNQFKKTAITANQVATTTGVLCPATAQGASPPNTCVAAVTGATAGFLGTACLGSSASCSAVINGYSATGNGVYCGGCIYKNSGETANAAGNWWTVADIAASAAAPSAGIFCPGDGTACSSVASGAAAASAGKFYSSATVAAGASATTAGVLCPTTSGAITAGGSSTGSVATASQGTAIGATAASNSAYRATTFPLVAVITGLAMMMFK